MQAWNEPDPEPLPLLSESAGLLPQAVRASVTAATPATTAPDCFRCTEFILSSSDPAPRRDRRSAPRACPGTGGAARATLPTVSVAARRPGRPSQEAKSTVHYWAPIHAGGPNLRKRFPVVMGQTGRSDVVPPSSRRRNARAPVGHEPGRRLA